MQSLFTEDLFKTFGHDPLFPDQGTLPLTRVRAGRQASLRARVRRHCPRRPGVYGMVNLRGELVYVGKAKCLRTRLLSYFRTKSRDPKAGRILRHARTIVWEESPSEFAALLRELDLIRRWKPRLNVHGQPLRRRRWYVCLGRPVAPCLFLASKPPARVKGCFGPVPASRKVREAIRCLNNRFGLRDCPQKQEVAFADQKDLIPMVRAAGCIRLEIGTCLGPCAAACTHTTYAESVQKAHDFLAGSDLSLLDELEREMQTASKALAFERAAALRDNLEALRWLRGHLDRMKQMHLAQSFVYPVLGSDGAETWYLIHGGVVAAAIPKPADESSLSEVRNKIRKLIGQKLGDHAALRADEVDRVFLVATWFRRHPEERNRLMDPATLS